MNDSRLILVVDDEIPVREFVCRYLSWKGFRIVEAADGNDALEMVQNSPVDLVLSDLCMPGMDGISLIRALKPLYPELKVVVMSGYIAGEETIEELQGMGVLEVLEKPFLPEELLAAVQSALEVIDTNSKEVLL